MADDDLSDEQLQQLLKDAEERLKTRNKSKVQLQAKVATEERYISFASLHSADTRSNMTTEYHKSTPEVLFNLISTRRNKVRRSTRPY